MASAAVWAFAPEAAREGAAGFPHCWPCPLRHQRRPELCLACFEASTPIPVGPACPVCGQAHPMAAACRNSWCARADRAFTTVFAAGSYAGMLRRAIVDYKGGDQRWWSGVLARLLAGLLRARSPWFEEFELLVGVPGFVGAGARRRWDPVANILDELTAVVGRDWEVAPGAIIKTTDTGPMRGRNEWERRMVAERDLRPSLVVPDPSVVAGRRLLIVDDVFTEGSTLQEVARCLRRAGAWEVAGLVVARPPWQGPSAGPAAAETQGRR